MIVLKTRREIELMREAGRISAEALKLAGQAVQPGITTAAGAAVFHHSAMVRNGQANMGSGLQGYGNRTGLPFHRHIVDIIPDMDTTAATAGKTTDYRTDAGSEATPGVAIQAADNAVDHPILARIAGSDGIADIQGCCCGFCQFRKT